MICKTIILSNSENLSSNAPKGILTLSNEGSYTKGKIRLYNLVNLPEKAKIGLYIQQKVHMANIVKRPNHYEFDLTEPVNINDSIYCAILDNTNHDKKVILEGGSANAFCFSDSPFDAVIEAKDEELETTIDLAIKTSDTCNNCHDCSNCEYKNYFYSHYTSQNDNLTASTNPATSNDLTENNTHDLSHAENADSSNKNEDLLSSIQSNVINTLESDLISSIDNAANAICNLPPDNNCSSQPNTSAEDDRAKEDITPMSETDSINDNQTEFLNDIIYQLDEMFKKYPADEMLNSIIPDSKFIYVTADNPYVVGVIYENKMMRYIAYGVPAAYNSLPPADFGKHYQWLPLNPRDVMSDGYFMIYQDASTGQLVEINFEE